MFGSEDNAKHVIGHSSCPLEVNFHSVPSNLVAIFTFPFFSFLLVNFGVTMPPRRRPQFTQDHIDQQLQQIHLLDPSSSSENLEQLGPIIKQIHANRQQDAYLRTVQALIDSKDAEIEKICSDNYQDFISSVSTLFTVKSYTDMMKENISSLDTSVSHLGGGLVEKKRALLQTKKTAANLDEAIDTLQACLRVLDVVDRIAEMVREGKYWSALRVCRLCYYVQYFTSINMHWLCSHLKTFEICLQHHSHRHPFSSIFSRHCLLYEVRLRIPLLLP